MPISAEEWRVRTGLNSVRVGKFETCPGKRMYKCDWPQSDRVFLTTIMIMVISFTISLLLMNEWSELSLLNTLYMTIVLVLVALDFSFTDTTHTDVSSVAVTCVSSTLVIHNRNETVMRHLGIVSIATIVLPLLLLLAGDVETNPGPETEDCRYQTMVICSEKIVHGLSQDPRAMATALLAKGFISDQTFSEINEITSTNKLKGKRLYQSILGVVKQYPHRYKDFKDTLQENRILYSDLLLTMDETYKKQLQSNGEKLLYPLSPINIYARHLKDYYLKQPILQDDPWPPSMGQHYINLALIERLERPVDPFLISGDLLKGKIDKIQGRKKPVELNQALERDYKCKQTLKILIDGAPGVGKTTLCRKICQDWAKGELLKDCPLLVYIPLRVTKLARASKIEELFYHDDLDIGFSVVKHVRKTRGADVIFLFDGYDELSCHEREKESIFLEIFNGRILQECSAIVCSRPYASEKLQRMSTLTRHIEVLGFNKQQMEECIRAGIQDEVKGQHLIEELRNREDLLSLCYIPLNCAILIYIYKVENCTIPATITELFALFLKNTVQRQKDIHCTHKSDLERYKDDLSRIAYQSLLKDKLAFQDEEVPSEKEARLGLLTATKNYIKSGLEITFQFIHLTIHEYLAANWIERNFTEKGKAEFLKQNLLNDRFRMVLIFLAGITKLESQSITEILSTQNIRMYSEVDETKDSRKQHKNRFDLCLHLVHEAHSQLACAALAESMQDQVLEYRISDKFKLNLIAYFISQSHCSWKIVSLIIDEVRPDYIDFDTFLNHLQRSSSKTSIRRFSLAYYNDKHNGSYPLPEVLWSLFKTSIFNDLRYLCAFEFDNIAGIASFFNGPSEIENKLILKNLENLEQIYLERIGLNREVIEKSLIPLIKHCKQTLKIVYISRSSALHEDLTIQAFNDFTFGILDSASIELVHLEIGPIPLYPIKEALEVFHFICLTAGCLSTLKQLRSLSFRCECSYYSAEKKQQAFSMIERRACSPNWFIMALVVSETLRYLKLDPYFLLNCKQYEMYLLLEKNQYLKILNIVFDRIMSPDLLNQLTEGLKQNVGLETLKLSIWCDIPELLLYKLLPSLHNHPNINTFVLKSRYSKVIDVKPVSKLLLYNSNLTTIDIKGTLDEVKSIVPCLVFNGRRTEFDFLSPDYYNHKADQAMETFQMEVDTFKNIVFNSMLKVLSYILLHRQKIQQHVLDHVVLYLMLKVMSKIMENRLKIQHRVIKSKLPCLTLGTLLKVMSYILLRRQKTQQQILDHFQY